MTLISTVKCLLLSTDNEIRIFLKEEVEQSYENISIEWIAGEQAVMTIYRGEERVGKVNLYLLQTREEMHNVMKEKVFVFFFLILYLRHFSSCNPLFSLY